jgi:hypothetical protein
MSPSMVAFAHVVAAGVAEEHRDLVDSERVLGAHQDRDRETAFEVGGQ